MKKLLCILWLLSFSASLHANIKLPSIIGNGMVLQRNANILIWGWGRPGEHIRLSFLNKNHTTTTDESGNWKLSIKTGNAGGPYTMTVNGDNKIIVKDILLGDVYLCSGQSNMAFKMDRIKEHYAKDINNSENNKIRQIVVKSSWSPFLKNNIESGGWQSASPESLLNFSAVGYYFSKYIFDKYKIPIGIINASYSATIIEGWISKEGLEEFPHLIQKANQYSDTALIKKITENEQDKRNHWFTMLDKKDIGEKENNNIVFNSTVDSNEWKAITIPGFWNNSELKGFTGSVWFKRNIVLTPEMIKQEAKFYVGAVDDRYTAYINGNKVGSEWQRGKERVFTLPPDLLKQGNNTIVIRVINPEGLGGFYPGRQFKIKFTSGEINLDGQWLYKPGVPMPALASQSIKFNLTPSFLYTSMINPIKNYKIKGVAWYQGEGNASRATEYRKLLPALITDWRTKWNEPELPFLIVQLANYGNPNSTSTSWAQLREAQTMALSLKQTAIIVTHDIGETLDIHPKNKKEVGQRLSLAARRLIYNENITSSGPVFQKISTHGDEVTIYFNNIGGGLVSKSKDGYLKGFEISGADKKFVPANAVIKANTVIIKNKLVKKPVAVRYAWRNNPTQADLYNKEGLPASSFRTDNWKLK